MKSSIRNGCILPPLETIDLFLVLILREIQSGLLFLALTCVASVF